MPYIDGTLGTVIYALLTEIFAFVLRGHSVNLYLFRAVFLVDALYRARYTGHRET